jgi:hypothetical protein
MRVRQATLGFTRKTIVRSNSRALFCTLVSFVYYVWLLCVTFSDDWKLLGEENQCQATLTIKKSESRKEFVEYCRRNSADPCISSPVTWVHLCLRVFKWASCRTKRVFWVFLFCWIWFNRSVDTLEDTNGFKYFLRLETSTKCLVIFQSDDTYDPYGYDDPYEYNDEYNGEYNDEYNDMSYHAAFLEYCHKPSRFSPKLMEMESTSYRL